MRSTLRPLFAILAAALLASACATTPSGPAAFTVGTLTVHRYGDHGRPLILIPGLGSGAWVWDGTVAQFEGDHVIYVLTLAGFDGTPLPANHENLMGQADASLLELIRSHNIDHPVLVGHSLGGTLALQFASEHADLLSGVVAVDGLPVFPGTQDMSAEQRAAIGRGMSARMAALSPEQFREQQLAYMQTIGLIDPAMAAKYAALQDQSDPAAVAEYAGEDLALDLRPQLKNIGVPVLEISPYNPPDFAKDSKLPISEAQKTAYYQMLLAGIPNVEVESISPSRHFAMLDQPQKFYDILNTFLASLQATQPSP
ncbi:MAG TPA: alpha/beta hydrolase [Gammaproteobacteria bacterium]|nr:alpha/beta hydrolase [Gammaproteobacteria bacterium]